MSEVIVYGVPGSPFVRSARLALEEKAAPYRFHALAPGEARGPEYLKLHPFGRIPAIDHDGYQLYETQAILRYVDAAFPGPALQPSEPRAIGRMNQIIGINDWYLFPQVSRVIVFQRIVGPALMGTVPDEAAIARAMPDAERCIGALERLLGSQAFMAGEQLTLADLMLAPQIDFLHATPEGQKILQDTALLAWLERMRLRDSMRATQPPEALHGRG